MSLSVIELVVLFQHDGRLSSLGQAVILLSHLLI
jgi:hypothetical protein